MPQATIAVSALKPHDPLPDVHSVVLMRRLAEDDPRATTIEMIVTAADRSERNATPVDGAGHPLDWAGALAQAKARAAFEGLTKIWVVDRTGGKFEADVIAHAGDHGFAGEKLDDTDPEDGVTGSDMRDGLLNAAPRKF